MKPSKKARQKLASRVKEYEDSIKRVKYPRGWRKPGSLNTRKS